MAGRLVERQEHRQERQRRQEQGLGGWRSRWRRAEERSRPASLRLRQGPQEGGRRQLPEPKAPERNPRAPQQSPRAPPGGWPQRGGRLCTGRRRRLAEPGSSQLCRGGRSTWKPGGRRGPEHPGRVGGAHRTDEAVAKAVATLHAELCGKGAVEEALVKVTVAASRLYLLGMNLLPLLVCMKHPAWWTEKLPEGASDHKKVRAWRDDPKNKQKMFRALAAMVGEKIAADADYGKNDAAALFGKTPAATGEEDENSDSDSKAKKSKKEKDKKKKKHTKKSSSGTSGSSSRRARAGRRARGSKKDEKKRSSSESKSQKASKKKEKKRSSSEPRQSKKDKQKKEKKRSSSEPRQSKRSKPEQPTAVKVRRVSGMTPDNRVLVKADDRFDEVPIQSSEWTVQDWIEELFKVSGQEEDAKNWTAKALVDGKCVPLSMDSTPATIRKGG